MLSTYQLLVILASLSAPSMTTPTLAVPVVTPPMFPGRRHSAPSILLAPMTPHPPMMAFGGGRRASAVVVGAASMPSPVIPRGSIHLDAPRKGRPGPIQIPMVSISSPPASPRLPPPGIQPIPIPPRPGSLRGGRVSATSYLSQSAPSPIPPDPRFAFSPAASFHLPQRSGSTASPPLLDPRYEMGVNLVGQLFTTLQNTVPTLMQSTLQMREMQLANQAKVQEMNNNMKLEMLRTIVQQKMQQLQDQPMSPGPMPMMSSPQMLARGSLREEDGEDDDDEDGSLLGPSRPGMARMPIPRFGAGGNPDTTATSTSSSVVPKIIPSLVPTRPATRTPSLVDDDGEEDDDSGAPPGLVVGPSPVLSKPYSRPGAILPGQASTAPTPFGRSLPPRPAMFNSNGNGNVKGGGAPQAQFKPMDVPTRGSPYASTLDAVLEENGGSATSLTLSPSTAEAIPESNSLVDPTPLAHAAKPQWQKRHEAAVVSATA